MASCRFRDIQCRAISRSMVNQGHWKWYHSEDWLWIPISVL